MSGILLFFGSIGGGAIASRLSRASVAQLASFSTSSDGSSTSKVKKSPIYTRTGDKGTTSLYNGERRPKTDLFFHALGNVDELNASLGIAREHCLVSGNGLDEKIVEIQSRLFDVGAAIATPINNSSDEKLQYTKFPGQHTLQLEAWIDLLDVNLPPLKNFILPSGGLSSTHLNLSRTICRRAERSVIPLQQDGFVDAEVGKYLNRLSDFLFVAARFAAAHEGKVETIWKK
eukprot:gene4436-4755_t